MNLLAATTLCALAIGQVDPRATQAYAELLQEHVLTGLVDYDGIRKDRARLDSYLAAIAKAKVPAKKDAAVAFYIDAYNALVLDSVLDAGQPSSVLNQKNFFTSPRHTVSGRKISLDALEKNVINPLAEDPRTHMVLVCAAKGCPALDREPYVGSSLEDRLEKATRRYLQSPAGSRVAKDSLALSKIFEWYAADFGGEKKILSFVRARLTDTQKNELGEAPSISYLEYDWRLNKR